MKIVTYIIIKSIKCYKFLISPLFGHSCRYLPTCSEYCIEALQTYNLPKALYLSLKRILSCHPWGSGGFDPVKKEMKDNK